MEIRSYISEELENPVAADATVRKILKTMRSLEQHAMQGTPLAAVAETKDDYRYLVSGNYMIFYRPFGRDVYGHVSETMKHASASRMENYVQSVLNA